MDFCISDEFQEKKQLPLADADITLYPNFLSAEAAARYFKLLKKDTPWQQDDIKVFGKVYKQPRLTALYGEEGKQYGYANIVMKPHPFTPDLIQLKKIIEKITGTYYNVVLLNLYRDGSDSNGWHSDDEKELGTNPSIASLSLGAKRSFKLRHKKLKSLRHQLVLDQGSLLLMKGPTQHFWQHQIPKTKKEVGPRINLTFRNIKL